MANSFEFIQQWPAIQNALDQAHGLGLDNISFDAFVDVGDRVAIWKTLFSDGILTFESDYKCPFKHIAATIEPVQSGTGDPSPDNIRPISGWTGAEIQGTGKNLCGDVTIPQIAFAANRVVNPVYLKAGQYTISFSGRSAVTAIYIRKGENVTFGGNAYAHKYSSNVFTFTADEDGYYYAQLYRAGSTPTWEDEPITHAWLEPGSTATAYEPYQGSSLSINWQDSAGTVYGGTLAIDEDGSCKLTVEYAKYAVTSFSGAFGAVTNGYCVYVAKTGTTHLDADASKMKCNIFKYSSLGRNEQPLFSYGGVSGGITTHTFILPSTITSLAEANAWLADNPVECTFKLAEPIVINLPDVTMLSSLLGTNNIWASTGGIAVTYKDANPLFLTDPLNVGVMTLK